jgi:hypothetical protein
MKTASHTERHTAGGGRRCGCSVDWTGRGARRGRWPPQFSEQWTTGTLEDSDAAFRRFTDALQPAFEMIVASGAVLVRAGGALLRAAHATIDDSFAIEIGEAVARTVGKDVALVTYEEWHFGQTAVG